MLRPRANHGKPWYPCAAQSRILRGRGTDVAQAWVRAHALGIEGRGAVTARLACPRRFSAHLRCCLWKSSFCTVATFVCGDFWRRPTDDPYALQGRTGPDFPNGVAVRPRGRHVWTMRLNGLVGKGVRLTAADVLLAGNGCVCKYTYNYTYEQ